MYQLVGYNSTLYKSYEQALKSGELITTSDVIDDLNLEQFIASKVEEVNSIVLTFVPNFTLGITHQVHGFIELNYLVALSKSYGDHLAGHWFVGNSKIPYKVTVDRLFTQSHCIKLTGQGKL
ncbi:hypothetical protein AB6E94_19475 [Vibrio lentus]|uniref:hypothetical protein n=1 Tax=Vibrio splendidus TaxID=29497 RepID=UPI000C82E685|nr:hypothetical protein [Vibrio splendidus]PMG17884.1 hypothetical protein BCU98_00695 [Vibrio splendidus]